MPDCSVVFSTEILTLIVRAEPTDYVRYSIFWDFYEVKSDRISVENETIIQFGPDDIVTSAGCNETQSRTLAT
jgi:hypothetical protein